MTDIDLHMTRGVIPDPRTGLVWDTDPIVIAIDQPARGHHDPAAEATQFVDLIAETLPPETLQEVFARLAGALADQTNVLTVIGLAVRGMER